ncbi:MAG: gliding motility lipoprotein GldH [Bacteroidales bacterium]|nr:gliding motility lipoprotein GldH [Bacteroidales bacterium]
MSKANFFIVFISCLTLLSCDRNGIYDENINTVKNSWSENNTAKFQVNIKDTISSHNIYVNIRNTADYPNSNLYLFITTTSPAGFTKLDTLECLLADEQGNWLGKGFGYLRDNRIPYKHNIRFPLKGSYKFEIKQAMRTEELKGIAAIGIRVEKSNLK